MLGLNQGWSSGEHSLSMLLVMLAKSLASLSDMAEPATVLPSPFSVPTSIAVVIFSSVKENPSNRYLSNQANRRNISDQEHPSSKTPHGDGFFKDTAW